eukprot:11394256-Ditylum_brightwellii.AAC.1
MVHMVTEGAQQALSFRPHQHVMDEQKEQEVNPVNESSTVQQNLEELQGQLAEIQNTISHHT